MVEEERRDFYPPRFQVFLASSPKDTTLSDAKIKFKGAECDLHYDIYLDPPNPYAHCTPVSPTQCMLLYSLPLSLY